LRHLTDVPVDFFNNTKYELKLDSAEYDLKEYMETDYKFVNFYNFLSDQIKFLKLLMIFSFILQLKIFY